MSIILPKGASYMSVVIAICNSKTAMLFADSRKITPVEDGFLIDDEFDKIYKLNDKVLVGMTGILTDDEEICAPFAEILSDSLDVDTACDAIVRYIRAHESSGEKLLNRCYILSGLDKKRKICIAFVAYDENGNLSVQRAYGKDGDKCMISLPPMLQNESSVWNKRFSDSIQTRDGIGLIEKVERFIAEIASKSQTVNTNVQYLAVTKDRKLK